MKHSTISLRAMGYRRLLKNYLQHVDQLVGSTLIESVGESELFHKRDVGELNNIVAELDRESANRTSEPDIEQGVLLADIIHAYGLTVEDVAKLARISSAKLSTWCCGEPGIDIEPPTRSEFCQVVIAILGWHANQRSRSRS